MKAKTVRFRALSLSLLCLAVTPPLSARTIYQYVDPQGAMTFSDSPPEFTNDYLAIELPDEPDPSPVAAEDELEKMVEMAEKLEATRRQKEEERRQKEEEKKAPPPPEESPQQEPGYNSGYYYPGYVWGGVRPPRNPGYVNHIPDDPVILRRHELRVPLRIPAFGTGQNYQDRIQPYPELNQR